MRWWSGWSVVWCAMVLLAAAGGGLAAEQVRYDGYKVVRFLPTDEAQATRLAIELDARGLQPLDHGCRGEDHGHGHDHDDHDGHAHGEDYLVSPGDWLVLGAMGVPFEVIDENVQVAIDVERSQLNAMQLRGEPADWFATYHNDAAISERVNQLVAERPEMATRLSLGTTLEGRDLYAVSITAPSDDPTAVRGKPIFFITAGQHAREWAAISSAMYIIDTLLHTYESDDEVRRVLDTFRVVIVPVVNRDGYEYSWAHDRLWRKNMRRQSNGSLHGVDLNRNWSFQWGGRGASSWRGDEIYRGPSPFSEPESAALAAWVEQQPYIAAHIDIHTFGQFLLEPWAYTSISPPHEQIFTTISGEMQWRVFDETQRVYYAGSISNTLYLASGNVVDWMYGEHDILSWCVELRPSNWGGSSGFILPPGEIRGAASEAWAAFITAALSLTDRSSMLVAMTPSIDGVVVRNGEGEVEFVMHGGTAGIAPGAVPRVNYAVGSAPPASGYLSAALVSEANGRWKASLPDAPCGKTLWCYIEVDAANGGVVRHPTEGAIPVGRAAFHDNFESGTTWTIGAAGDSPVSKWSRKIPDGRELEPALDHSSSGPRQEACFFTSSVVTGQRNDVDGVVTLTSPSIDLASAADVQVSYWRWFAKDSPTGDTEDSLQVFVSNDDGQTWALVETITDSETAWRRAEWRVADYVTPTANVRVRFVAGDLGADNTVEAAVDDFAVVVLREACPPNPCPADFDRSGAADVMDLFAFINAWLTRDMAADMNTDDRVDVADLFAYINAWLARCEGIES